jgi:glycosyltransferase involved in cell wall biosynthesis
MTALKPRLAIVSSYNICCALAYYATALKEFLDPAFEVEIVDLKTTNFLRQEGSHYQKISDAYIDDLCERLREFDIVNVHLELGLYGSTVDRILSRILKICQASGRLILTVHTISYRDTHSEHTRIYQQIMHELKRRPSTNPFHLIAHLPQEGELLKKHFNINNVSDFPLIYLTNERRKYFQERRNPNLWKRQFGLKDDDITIGVFGLLSAHKNYLHALRTVNILPEKYKLLVVGEIHHMNVREGQVDPLIQEMVAYLEAHPGMADRVIFTGKRDDADYYEDLANVDFVLLPSFEVWQSGSATFSNALELERPIVKSNTANCRGYEIYFPDCFEMFDIGNYYETKQKILNFDKAKIANIRQRIDLYSEVQLREMYLNIYESMKGCTPVPLTSEISPESRVRRVFNLMPSFAQSLLRKLKKKYSLSIR